MRFASATTTEQSIEGAAQHLVFQIAEQIETPGVDLALLLLSPHFENAATFVADAVRRELAPQVLLGCTGEGLIGREQELEDQAAMVLIVARLPGVELRPFALHPKGLDDILDDPDLFLKTVAAPRAPKLFLVIGDPYSMRMGQALNLFNTFYAGVPVVGGMTSAPQGQNALLFGRRVLTGGAVGVAFAGSLEVDVVVSQGCHPVGPTFTITQARENLILSLDGQPPLVHIRELVARLSEADRALLQHGFFVGRAVQPDGESLGRGDFLVRGVMGIDEQSGAVAVADYVRFGETIRFHLRDATTAREDLELMLTPQRLYGPPSGALLFSCNGRGTQLHGQPNGDLSTVQRYLGGVPLAGMFCAGEIGPLFGQNFLHGHTVSLALFRPPDPELAL